MDIDAPSVSRYAALELAIVLTEAAKARGWHPPRPPMPYVVRSPLRFTLVEGKEVYPFAGPPQRYLRRGLPILRRGGADRDCPSSAVYAIRCERTGRKYIGSTRFLGSRWSSHLSDLRLGTHKNRWLLRDWRAMGPDAFTLVVIHRISPGQPRHEMLALEEIAMREGYEEGGTYNVRRAYGGWLDDED